MNQHYRGVEIVPLDFGGYAWHSDDSEAADVADTIEQAKDQIDAALGPVEPCIVAQVTFDDLCGMKMEPIEWYEHQAQLAGSAGNKRVRLTANAGETLFLFEAWQDFRTPPGPPRWIKP